MVATFPQLRDANVDYVWGGTLDVTFDEMPHVGKLDGMYYAIGYVGHGVALATLCGSLAASAIVDGTLDPTFAGDPPAMLGYNGRPWFLPLVGAWNRMLDAVS